MHFLLFLPFTVATLKQPQDFSPPANCINENFDLSAYLKEQQLFDVAGVGVVTSARSFSGVRTEASSGWMHRWSRIGTGQSCLDIGSAQIYASYVENNHFDASGCMPYTEITSQFEALQACLPNPSRGFKRNKSARNKPFTKRHVISKLAQLSQKRDVEWRDATKLKYMAKFTEEEMTQIAQCVNKVKSIETFKCWTVIMGQPGVVDPQHSESLIQDHTWVKNLPGDEYSCKVPAACGRITLQQMYNFQMAHYDRTRIYSIAVKYPKWYSFAARSGGGNIIQRNYCSLKNIGASVCWLFSDCTKELMKQTCHEHPECCPTSRVHGHCSNLKNPNCWVCPYQER